MLNDLLKMLKQVKTSIVDEKANSLPPVGPTDMNNLNFSDNLIFESVIKTDADTLQVFTENAEQCLNGKQSVDVTLDAAIWHHWLTAIIQMQARALQRGWELEPFVSYPPATQAQITAFESKHQRVVPEQLRKLWLGLSAQWSFGWRIPEYPTHQRPKGELGSIYCGGIRNLVWSAAHTEEYAIGNFEDIREYLLEAPLERRVSGKRSRAALWDAQFPFAYLDNGDILTIDTSKPNANEQVVRYFSHEHQGMDADIIAPNLYAFFDQWTAFGCAGGDEYSWEGLFNAGKTARPTAKAKLWQKYLTNSPKEREENEAPSPIACASPADKALLLAAKNNDLEDVRAALLTGANADCSDLDSGVYELMTAHNYAVEHSNLEMLELLETYGAKINVPRLGLNDALGALDMTVAIWLIDKGSRLQGWEGELSPLECLFKSNPTSETDRENFQQLLDKLLAAGAKPEGQLLSGCGPKTTAKLLKAGADASVRDAHGKTALFYANSADSIHLLVNAGLNLEELASKLIGGKAMTPLQTVLTLNDHLNPIHRATQFIEAGANPLTPDNQGYNALWHCRWADCAALIVAQGLDPKAHDGQGCTLLHRMFQQMGTVMLERDVPLLAFWLSLGVDVHHINHLGNTVLHAAALASKQYWGCDDGDLCVLIEKLLVQGVDKSVKNLEGKTAVQLLKKSFKKCHVALK